MKHYDNPQDMLRIMKELSLQRQSAYRSPFTGMVTLLCYVLWKDFNASIGVIETFLSTFNTYVQDSTDWREMSGRLYDYVGWKVEYVPWTIDCFPKYKNPIYIKTIQATVDDNNQINELSSQYLTYGFVSLMDMKWTQKRLTNYKDKVNSRLDVISQENKYEGIMDYWQQLKDEAGLEIEKPKFE